MGTRTSNMSIYKPSPGETVYDPSFSAGLDNIDSHDHSGAPNKGVQIGTSGIQDGAITPAKLSQEILAEATVQTTNNTPTEIVSVSVAESQCVEVSGRITALKSDTTESVGGNFLGNFLRPTGSTVEEIGRSVINIQTNSTGTPYMQLVADTGNNAVSIRVVGETSKTIDWHIVYNVVQQPET